MNQIFKVINAYYNDFESYHGVISFKSLLFWLIILSLLAFFSSFYWYINLSAFPYLPNLSRMWRILICMVFEITTLASWFALIKKRDNIIVQKLQHRFNSKETNILKLKSLWFRETLGVKPTEYLNTIDLIDKAITYKEKHKSNFNFGKKQIFDSIFQSESKNRLWAIMIGCIAITVALMISSGISINNFFQVYQQITNLKFIAIVFTYSVFIMMMILIIKYILLFFDIFLDNFNGSKHFNIRRANVFINQLLIFVELPKGRHKVEISNKDDYPIL